MDSQPMPSPEGRLLTAALKASGLSAREAARRAGISEGRWRQIASGYQVVAKGRYAAVRGPAATVARMAVAAGVTPAALENAGRPDAARLLAAWAAEDASQMLRRVRAMTADQARELLAQLAATLGVDEGGGQGHAAGD